MAEEYQDDLCLYLQNGRFNLMVTRQNESLAIKTINSPHFYEVLAGLCSYHRDCVVHFHSPEVIDSDRERKR